MDMTVLKKFLTSLSLVFLFNILVGQQNPVNPVYYWVFNPYVYNPAISGSKDFISIDLATSFRGKINTEFIGANTRLSRKQTGYFSTPDMIEYENIGISGSLFNDVVGSTRNMGANLAGSYQFPLDDRRVSFISVGGSVKGIYNSVDTGSIETGRMYKKTFFPNADFGVYYYGPSFFAGLSVVNMLGNPEKPDSHGHYLIPVARQYFLSAGYKIIISRTYDIVLEPSLLINAYDSTFKHIEENIDPVLKLYVDNLCLGSYFFTNGSYAFFAKYKYPGFYIGAFFDVPKKTPLYKRNPTIEFTLGLNIQPLRHRKSGIRHW
jgi:type IX secretion system PorP/SprF family membrane protein